MAANPIATPEQARLEFSAHASADLSVSWNKFDINMWARPLFRLTKMRFNNLLGAIYGLVPIAPVLVQANPCRPGKDAFCVANSAVLTALQQDVSATTFCLEFLSASTTTVISTVSVTPSASVTVVSSTLTASTVTSTVVSEELRSSHTTVTSTDVSFSTTTTTLTTSTLTLSCLDSAYTAKPPTSSGSGGFISSVQSSADFPVSTRVPDKRELSFNTEQPTQIPAEWPESAVSSICSCLSLPTPTITETTTISVAPSIHVITATETYTPGATVTSSFESVSTSTFTSVSVSVSVVIETEYATATTIATTGAAPYRRYDSPYDANLVDGGFTAAYFSPSNPARPLVLSSGSLASLTFSTPYWPGSDTYLYLDDGDTFDSEQSALLFQGFFVARQTGTYYLSSSGDYIDNYGYLWIGDVSYSTWNDANTAFQASRTGAGYYSGNVAVDLNEGDAIPIAWLWSNGGGVGQSWFSIESPDGSSTTDTTGFLVPACSADTFA